MALEGLTKLVEDLERFDSHTELLDIIERNGSRIVELQQEQLSFGVDVHGEKRSDEYRPLTVYLKEHFGQGLGAVTDRVTFFMTGEMYGLMENEVDGDEFVVKANTFKYDKMIERVGEENYGLEPFQRQVFYEEVTLPQFGEALLEKTGLIL